MSRCFGALLCATALVLMACHTRARRRSRRSADCRAADAATGPQLGFPTRDASLLSAYVAVPSTRFLLRAGRNSRSLERRPVGERATLALLRVEKGHIAISRPCTTTSGYAKAAPLRARFRATF